MPHRAKWKSLPPRGRGDLRVEAPANMMRWIGPSHCRMTIESGERVLIVVSSSRRLCGRLYCRRLPTGGLAITPTVRQPSVMSWIVLESLSSSTVSANASSTSVALQPPVAAAVSVQEACLPHVPSYSRPRSTERWLNPSPRCSSCPWPQTGTSTTGLLLSTARSV